MVLVGIDERRNVLSVVLLQDMHGRSGGFVTHTPPQSFIPARS